jgi:hypothetical protein
MIDIGKKKLKFIKLLCIFLTRNGTAAAARHPPPTGGGAKRLAQAGATPQFLKWSTSTFDFTVQINIGKVRCRT